MVQPGESGKPTAPLRGKDHPTARAAGWMGAAMGAVIGYGTCFFGGFVVLATDPDLLAALIPFLLAPVVIPWLLAWFMRHEVAKLPLESGDARLERLAQRPGIEERAFTVYPILLFLGAIAFVAASLHHPGWLLGGWLLLVLPICAWRSFAILVAGARRP